MIVPQIKMNKLKIKIILISLLIMLTLSGCGLDNKNEKETNNANIPPKDISKEEKTEKINNNIPPEIKATSTNIFLSGITAPLDEVSVSPKINGKVVSLYAKEGDEVKIGQTIIQLEQDQVLLTAYNNAQANLTNTISSANQNISMTELSVSTAQTNLDNTKINTSESIKNAELSVQTAKTALINSENLLKNTGDTSKQATKNAYDNIKITMQSNLTAIKTSLTSVGDIIGEKPGSTVANDDYEDVLGVKDSQSLTNTKGLFFQANNSYEASLNNYNILTINSPYNEIDQNINNIDNSLDLIKQTLNETRILLDNTITKSGFTYSNLSALKTSIDANLISINSSINILQAGKQTIINSKLAETTGDDTTQSAYDLAKNSLEKAEQTLLLTQTQSKSQIDSVAKQLESAQANLKSTKIRANQQITMSQGQLNSVKAQLGNTIIKAPISGILNKLLIDSGEMAIAGKPIAVIVDINGIKIESALTEFDIIKINKDQEVKISLAAYPDQTFLGKIYYVSSVSDAINKKFPIKIQINNKDKKIKAGMIAEINIDNIDINDEIKNINK